MQRRFTFECWSHSYRAYQEKFLNVHMVLERIVACDISSKWMSRKIKLRKLFFLAISVEVCSHCLTPFFNVLYKIFYGLLSPKFVFIKVLRSRASTHAWHVKQHQAKVLSQPPDNFEVEWPWTCKAVNQHKLGLLSVTTDICSDEDIFIFEGADDYALCFDLILR